MRAREPARRAGLRRAPSRARAQPAPRGRRHPARPRPRGSLGRRCAAPRHRARAARRARRRRPRRALPVVGCALAGRRERRLRTRGGAARAREGLRTREPRRHADRGGPAPRPAPAGHAGERRGAARRAGRSRQPPDHEHGRPRGDRSRRGHRGAGRGAPRDDGGRRVSALELYNSRTRRQERSEPLEPGYARVYTCGPTVYSAQHVGNMRPNVFADLLKRALLLEGLRVTHVVNITDVGHLTDDADAGEDKMEVAARRSGRRAADIAAEFTAQWLRDRRRLGCLEPEVICKASEHIAEQIEMIRMLEARGVTYRIADGLYFDVAKFPRYAELARLDLARQLGGRRIGEVEGKRHPADFALWKLATPGERRQQEWDSPWGRGFAGWHIECSAMATKYLGTRFDIHTGGVEHLPVHHTNEVAQSEVALDVHPWVNVWMHQDWLVFGGEKMAKSVGNVALLQDLVDQGLLPLSLRYFFLQAHYRKQQGYSNEAIVAADRGYRRLLASAIEVRGASGKANQARVAPWRERFRAAVRDDLNAPRALALAIEMLRDATLAPADQRALLAEFDAFPGLELLTAELPAEALESDPRIDALVAEREAARRRRDFGEADRIRTALAAEGVEIEDTPQGPRWRRS